MNEIFIPNNIPSLKNSKIMGRFPSKTVQKWLRKFGIQHYSSSRKEVTFFKRIPKQYDFAEICQPIKNYTGEYPILMGFHFVRDSRRTWDFGNCCQILQDVMVAFDIIPDDNVNYLLPFPMIRAGKYWSYDKDNAGVWIRIM